MKLFLLLLILSLTACKSEQPPYSAPHPNQVKEISALLYSFSKNDPNGTEFKIPKPSYKKILKAIDGAHEHPDPMKWQALGKLKITLESDQLNISLYSADRDSFAFKVNGTYYRGSSEQELVKLISNATKIEK